MTVKAPAMSNISVTESYEKAVKKCKDRVNWIAEHYRLRNQRFRDREFDVEKDLVRCLYYYQQTEDLSRQPKDMLRITQIFDQPDFSLEIAKTSDLVQGNLDNCWFVSALSMVASKPELMGKICIAHDANVGVYGFVFFKNGQWIDVVIDDILAVKIAPWDQLSSSEKAIYHDNRENYNKMARKGSKILSFAAAVEEGVTLFPLVEKAFAKAHGDYGSLNHGYCHEGIEDLTGGVAISMATKDIMDPDKFWEDELMKANKDRMFGCSVDYNGNGLRGSHAYAITDVHEIDDHGKPRRFVRIRNPWGRSEWTGRWSDGSKEWTKEWLGRLDELGHAFGDDGEFLMEYDDFLTTWHDIQRCILFDDSWQMSVTWINASIRPPPCNWCYGDVSFTVEATQPTPTVFVLSQIDSRYFRGSRFSTTWHMDFKVYRHSEEDVETPRIVEESYPDPNPGSRSVSVTFNLEPGKYVVHVRLDKTENKGPGEMPPINQGQSEVEYTQERPTPTEPPPNANVQLPRKLSRVEAEAIRAIGFDDEMFHDNTYTTKSLSEMQSASGFHGQSSHQIAQSIFDFTEKHFNCTATLGLRVYTKKGAEVKVEGQRRAQE